MHRDLKYMMSSLKTNAHVELHAISDSVVSRLEIFFQEKGNEGLQLNPSPSLVSNR